MPRAYTMRGVLGVAAEATSLVRSHLEFAAPGSRIHDVQNDPRLQHRGVDLLWEREGHPVLGIEVKGDRQDKRGNYFFEVVSNAEKDTPGCFLYSTADWYAYVFVAPRELHLLPLSTARAWYLERSSEFPLRQTRTRLGKEWYTTIGALVPVRRVLAEVEGAQRWRKTPEDVWEQVPLRKPRASAA